MIRRISTRREVAALVLLCFNPIFFMPIHIQILSVERLDRVGSGSVSVG